MIIPDKLKDINVIRDIIVNGESVVLAIRCVTISCLDCSLHRLVCNVVIGYDRDNLDRRIFLARLLKYKVITKGEALGLTLDEV